MALSSSEVDYCKFECGYAATRIGSEPYIAYSAIFDQAIIPWVTDVGADSSTLVVAASAGARIALTVTANPVLPQKPNGLAFVRGVEVTVDLGPNREANVVVEAVVGLSLYVTLYNAHGVGGVAYPVVLSGAEQVVRDILDRLSVIRAELGEIAPRTAGVSQGGKDASLFASQGKGLAQRDKHDSLKDQRMDARDQLCQALNLPNLWRVRRGGQSTIEMG